MDYNAISIQSLKTYLGVNSATFTRQYKYSLSNYCNWEHKLHATEYLTFPSNMGKYLSIDEVCISNGELYTVLTNKSKSGKKGSIVGLFKGVKSDKIIKYIKDYIPAELRNKVEEITLDLSPIMNRISQKCFKNAKRVADRFHVQKLASEAIQRVRIDYRWESQKEENIAIQKALAEGEKYTPLVFKNGDTINQLLARSRHLLFKSRNKWTVTQSTRAKILFEQYPDIQKAYNLSELLKASFNHKCSKEVGWLKLAQWAEIVRQSGFESFSTIADTFYNYYDNISNYFNNRSSNAAAESFNAKIKDFRRKFRGVRDVAFFLYRLTKIYA